MNYKLHAEKRKTAAGAIPDRGRDWQNQHRDNRRPTRWGDAWVRSRLPAFQPTNKCSFTEQGEGGALLGVTSSCRPSRCRPSRPPQ